MATYIIETTTFSGMMRKDSNIYAKVSTLDPSDRLIICPNIRGEILFGIEKLPVGKKQRELQTKAQALFLAFESRDITDSIADQYAQIKCEAKVIGKSLSDNDLWIAASAIHHDAVLVATDKDYSGLSRLSVEDWAK